MSSRSGGACSARRLAALAIVFLVGLVAACEFPFGLRDSELPSGTSTRILEATEPINVKININRCINNRDAMSYESQIAEDFVFAADPRDSAYLEQTYPGIFAGWGAEVERDVMEYMLDNGRCSVSSLALGDSTIVEEGSTEYSITYKYDLSLVLSGEFLYYKGEARFYMRKESSDNLWRLSRWEDSRLQDSERDTWGILRGVLRDKTK
ncbi:MAG: hypothetical protein WAW06_00380 [bacterium]